MVEIKKTDYTQHWKRHISSGPFIYYWWEGKLSESLWKIGNFFRSSTHTWQANQPLSPRNLHKTL
jgi:hypothetical protein